MITKQKSLSIAAYQCAFNRCLKHTQSSTKCNDAGNVFQTHGPATANGIPQARFPFKRNRLRCVRCVNENRKKRKRQPIGMLGRSSGNHDWLLANASAYVSCGFRLHNASDCVWMESGLQIDMVCCVNSSDVKFCNVCCCLLSTGYFYSAAAAAGFKTGDAEG